MRTLKDIFLQAPDRYKAFLFDIDGTVLLRGTPIPGAAEFLQILRDRNLPLFFVTNNCAQTHEAIAERLVNAGIQAEPDEIISSADFVPEYFWRNNKTGKAWKYFAIGRTEDIPGVVEFEKDPGKIMECDGVLNNAGKYDWETTMTAMLNFFLRYPEKPFVVTNGDMLNPVPGGVTICSNAQMELIITLLRKSGIEKKRIHFGKPYPPIYEIIKKRLESIGVLPENTLAIGDLVSSDVLGANRSGIRTCLVLTGISTEKDIPENDPEMKPDHIVDFLS